MKTSSTDLRRVEENRSRIETESALLAVGYASSLDEPRRLIDNSTGLPTLTSLFMDFKPLADLPDGATIFYIHIPSSAIVEERFGWEALETYRSLIAHYLMDYAQTLRRERQFCVLARVYADDFVLIVPQRDFDDDLPIKLADGMTRHLLAVDEETASVLMVFVGITHSKPFPKIHPERLLYRMIQKAQTEATDVGRQKLSSQLRVLDRCISTQQFTMLFQPIVRVQNQEIFAYEALVRCPVPEFRSPHVLFNVAEQGGRIWPLSRLLRALSTKAIPQLPGHAHMFINLHPADFDDPEIIDVRSEMVTYAPHIVLEVTERAAITDYDQFCRKLRQLRDIGFRIAVDDLGSGYSSLNVVTELAPDFIKLDMTLIRGIEESSIRQNLVRNMIAFASDMNAQVVAEGVETKAELDTLTQIGAHFVQGFYLAVPAPPFVQDINFSPF